ncbi:oligosaccharide flippase family protein [Vitellibacter sp. q18]|nr:oligosaccharide flippase family protein [Aequorivita lutea]
MNNTVDRITLLFLKLKERGFFHLIISNYSVQFIVFGSSLLVAKIMSPTDVGIIKTIETFANMAIVLGGGGVIFAILKVIPEQKDSAIRRLSLLFSLKYATFFSLVIFLLFNLMAYAGLVSKDSKLIYWFHQYSFIIVPSVLTMLLIRYYQAIDRFKRISTVVFYLKLISAAFVLSFTYFFFIRGYVLSMVISTVLATLVLLYDLRKELIDKTKSERHSEIRQRIMVLSKTAFTAQVIDQLKLQSGFLIANYVILDREIFGFYAFALILTQGINIIASSVQQFIIPKMSEASANITLFFRKFRMFEKRFNVIAVAIFVLAQLFLPLAVTVIFGDKYDGAILILRIMLLGWLIEALYALKGVIFLSLGKMHYIGFASLTIFLISIPVIYYLDVKFAAMGAACAYVFQNLVSLGVLNYFQYRVSKHS